MTFRFANLSLFALLVLTMSACDEGKPKQEALDSPPAAKKAPSFYVDQATGADANPGTAASPFRSITHALSVATSGQIIQVLPGQYNAAQGETFPMVVPAGVTLLGDPNTKGVGGGVSPTVIQGSALVYSIVEAALEPLANATLSGFMVIGFPPGGGNAGMLVSMRSDGVTLDRNTFTGAYHTGIYVDGSSNHRIRGNDIVNNTIVAGLAFVAGANSVVEHNLITGNYDGLEEYVVAADLGGGPTGSAGGNTIYCNIVNDLWVNTGGTIYAMNNIWDHNPPSGNDVFNGGGATILLNGFVQLPGCATP